MLEYIILGFLMNDEMSGYDFKQCISTSTSYFFDASYGSIYPALKRLEKKKYIICNEIVNGGKLKKIYSITDEGRKYFLNWLEKPIVFSKTKHEHLVNIFFYEYLDKETAISNLNTFIEEIQDTMDRLNGQKSDVEKKWVSNEHIFMHSTMVFGVQYYEFLINCCKGLITRIEEV